MTLSKRAATGIVVCAALLLGGCGPGATSIAERICTTPAPADAGERIDIDAISLALPPGYTLRTDSRFKPGDVRLAGPDRAFDVVHGRWPDAAFRRGTRSAECVAMADGIRVEVTVNTPPRTRPRDLAHLAAVIDYPARASGHAGTQLLISGYAHPADEATIAQFAHVVASVRRRVASN